MDYNLHTSCLRYVDGFYTTGMAFGLTVKVAQTKIVSRGIVTPSFLDNWFKFETLIGFDV